ncbi:CdaR family protein [Paludifilum halophilum]|uniref:YbbR-like domain-containing protein YbbR n=1 Tax=Paludifilum halophilum TaxID=1642702 RepID=A0A235B3H1_9BACL|nr:CdaR family protein [Paludifilum halophilum]OYD06834.1 hypothetical protein CHM34_14895 [Paludifilum halophilum]
MDKWLQNNNVIKLVALVLAIMLWFSVNDASLPLPRDRESTTIKNVTLEARYDERRYEIVELPDQVDLYVQGDSFAINRISPDRYEAYVDLRKLGPGSHKGIPVQVDGLPRGLDVDVRPGKVDVVIEKKQQKEMPVDVEVIGTPDEDYKLGEPIAQPGKVLIRGSESLLEQVTAVKAVINAEGAKETIEQSVSLQVYGENGTISEAEVKPEVVDVTLPVASPNTVVPLKAEIDRNPPKGYAVEDVNLDTDEVTVYGSKGYIQELEYYPAPPLDLSKAKSDRTYKLLMPIDDGAVKVEPENVEISVDIVKGEEKELRDVPVQVKGLEQESTAQIASDESIDLTLFGAPSLLKKIGKADAEAYIDVSNLSPGKHKVPVQVNLPTYIRLRGEAPEAEVRISR